MPTPRAELTATASVRIATPGGTAPGEATGEATGVRGNGTVTGVPGAGGKTTTGASVARSGT
jgi:hypothetical protein